MTAQTAGYVIAPTPEASDTAAALWREEAVDVDAPPAVADRRTRAAFDDEVGKMEDQWRKFTRAAICALNGAKP